MLEEERWHEAGIVGAGAPGSTSLSGRASAIVPLVIAPRTALALALLLAPALRAEDEVRTHASGLRYLVLPPPGVEGGPVDLLLCLHGRGDDLKNMRIGLSVAVPELRRCLRVFVQAPEGKGWTIDGAGDVAALVKELQGQHPVRRTIGFGFSAGGNMVTVLLFKHPDVLQAALVAGATVFIPPPRDGPARDRPMFFSLGADDPITPKIGGAEGLRRLFDEAGWAQEAVRIDVLPGVGHTLSRPNLIEGMAWLEARLGGAAPATEAERAAVEAADDPDALRAAAQALAGAGEEARALLAAKREPLLSEKDPARARLACELLGWLGLARSVGPLERAIERWKKDEETAAAAALALGRIAAPAAEKARIAALKRSAYQGPIQVAAARGLANAGGEAALKPLVEALKSAEKRGDARLGEALELALRETTGQPLLETHVQWSMWLRQRKQGQGR